MNVQEALLQERVDPRLTDEMLTTVAARATCEQKGSSGKVRGFRILTGGCWNRVIGVHAGEADLVFKISPHPNDEKIIREYSVLNVFAGRSELPVPRPLLLDRGELLPGTTLVMNRIPGRVMHECFGYLGDGNRARITERIAEDLAKLHVIKGKGFGGIELPEEARHACWADFWLPRFDRILTEATESGVVPEALIAGAREIRTHLTGPLDIGPESTLTHYDIWSGNVMIDLDSSPPRVSGYIDIPGFYADYARELSFAMLFGVADRRFFRTYLRYHTLDPGFELRVNIYNLKMNIRHIRMYPSEPFYRLGAEENLAFIRRAL